jgi:hypothetical protein
MFRFIHTVTVGDERKVRGRLEVAKRHYFEGSSRKRADATRDKHSEARELAIADACPRLCRSIKRNQA